MDIKDAGFSDKEFDKLKFPVMKHEKNTFYLDIFPDISEIPAYIDLVKEYEVKKELGIHFDINAVFRYVCFCYDEQSPINRKFYIDEKKRKTWSAKFAGWDEDQEGNFAPEIVAIMNCDNQLVNNFIIDFMRIFHNPNYSMLMTYLETFYKALRAGFQEAQSEVKSKSKTVFDVTVVQMEILEKVKPLKREISTLAEEWLRDNNPNLIREFWNVMDKEKGRLLNITPERRLNLSYAYE